MRTASQLLLAIAIVMVVVIIVAVNLRGPAGSGRDTVGLDVPRARIEALRAGLQAADAGARLESAVGLLRAGQLEGGRSLIELAAGGDPNVRQAAASEWGRVGVPMAEAVGWPIDWPAPGGTPTPEQLARAVSFWDRRATSRLLADVLHRLAEDDGRWSRIDTVLARRNWLYKVSGTDAGNR